MITINYEIWKNGTKYIVARINGKLNQRIKFKGSGFKNKAEATAIYKKNNSFKLNLVRNRGKNLTENIITRKFKGTDYREGRFSKPMNKPRGLKVQYLVQGYIHGKLYYGRSHQLKGRPGICETTRECKEEAWDNFLRNVSKAVYAENYDADIGLAYLEDNNPKNIEEGWIYFS